MKKTIIKYKKPLIAGLILAVLLLGYFFRDKLFSWTKKDNSTPTAPTTPTTSNNTSSGINKDVVLKQGDRGASVSEMQRLLNEELKQHTPTLLSFLVVDGIFGPKTEARLEHFTSKKSMSINQLIVELSKIP